MKTAANGFSGLRYRTQTTTLSANPTAMPMPATYAKSTKKSSAEAKLMTPNVRVERGAHSAFLTGSHRRSNALLGGIRLEEATYQEGHRKQSHCNPEIDRGALPRSGEESIYRHERESSVNN